MKKDLLNATVIQDLLETEQQTAKVGNASPSELLIQRCIWRGKWAEIVVPHCRQPSKQLVFAPSQRALTETVARETTLSILIPIKWKSWRSMLSTILEIRKTIALLFQSSLTALVGAIKAKESTKRLKCATGSEFLFCFSNALFFNFLVCFFFNTLSWLIKLAGSVTTDDNSWYATISLENRRFSEKRATKNDENDVPR